MKHSRICLGSVIPCHTSSTMLLNLTDECRVQNNLQRIQNNLARVACQRGGCADAGPLLRSFHWFPLRQRVTYKVALTTFKVGHTATPEYLSDLLQTLALARSLRSSEAPTMVVKRTNTDLTRRAFSVAPPSIWNSLPSAIWLCDSTATFKRHLKTHLFSSSL